MIGSETFFILITICSFFASYDANQVCQNKICTLDDEFDKDTSGSDILTNEWNEFITLIDERTIQSKNYTHKCANNSIVTLNSTSNNDILWDIRMKIYEGDENGQSIQKCLTTIDCELTCGKFRECMREVRSDMTQKIKDNWDNYVEEAMEKLC